MRRDPERQLASSKDSSRPFVRHQVEVSLQLFKCRNSVLELPPPIVPLLTWNVWPMPRCVGDEPLVRPVFQNFHVNT